MNNIFPKTAVLLSCAAMASVFPSCVDEDYDLAKDIDLTVNVGGSELTLPVSSTDVLTLDQILDLESSSSIKAVSTDGYYGLSAGDYVLEQAGDPTSSNVNISEVHISDMKGNYYATDLDPFVNIGADRITVQASPHFNIVDLNDDDVTDELLSLDYARTAVDIIFAISYESDNFFGNMYVDRGFESVFDPSWYIEIVDPATAAIIELVNHHTIRFKEDVLCRKDSSVALKLRITAIDFTKVAPGQGLYEVGHFRLKTDVESNGTLSITGTELGIGQQADVRLITTTDVSAADLLAVTGRIDPHINVSATTFDITSIPDFLKEDNNNLDIENPMIRVSVNNMSPIDLYFNARLTSETESGSTVEIGIGSDFGTSQILVKADRVNEYVLSRHPVDIDGVENIIVEDLGKLISTVPDKIVIDGVRVQVPSDKTYTIELGHTYNFKNDYKAIIPLAFGKDLRLTYSDEDTGWDSDLEKYNFDRVNITADVINSLPLQMTLSVIALDREGNEIPDITATVSGDIAAGTIASPSTSSVDVILRSTAPNIKDLDGVRFMFDAVTDESHVGVPLNENQNLRFENIKVSVIGGITIDLND